MFFRKAKPAVCAVCGKAIDPREGRFVDKTSRNINETVEVEVLFRMLLSLMPKREV